jgi:protocatechuate 3,4-dioxygenase beta subunit
MATNRRGFLSYGFGSLVLAACGSRTQASTPRDALAPTPQIPDDDAPPADAFGAVCTVTADNIEGPFYKAGAPHRAVLATAQDDGERLVLGGTVRTPSCEPLANATLDVWHADARGGYDNDGWGMRGRLKTDKLGRWQIKSIVPGRYLNGRRYRPTHIHVKVRAAGHAELTTQLYFEGDPYNSGDDFIVSSLIMPHSSKDGVRRAAFDFVLASA